MIDARAVKSTGAPDNSVDFVAFTQKELCQIKTILTSNTNNQYFSHKQFLIILINSSAVQSVQDSARNMLQRTVLENREISLGEQMGLRNTPWRGKQCYPRVPFTSQETIILTKPRKSTDARQPNALVAIFGFPMSVAPCLGHKRDSSSRTWSRQSAMPRI